MNKYSEIDSQQNEHACRASVHEQLQNHLKTAYECNDDIVTDEDIVKAQFRFLKKDIDLRSVSLQPENMELEPMVLFSPNFVVRQCLARYFNLMARARKSMADFFSQEEIMLFLSSDPSDFSNYTGREGISDDDIPVEFLEKLCKLSNLQYASLVDFRETFYRSNGRHSFQSFLEEMGLILRKN